MSIQTPPQTPLLELDLLRTLVAISETGNFSSAADVVCRTPSAVSMQVKRMEELLGRPVFLRDSRSVRLTADGETLLEHARRLLALNREVMARFVEPDLIGEVRIGAPDDIAERFLPAMLRRFADTHPGVAPLIVVENTPRMMELVHEGRLDMAVVTAQLGFRGTENAEVIYREPVAWAMLKSGVAMEKTPLPISAWEEECLWRKAAIDGLVAQGRDHRVVFESGHISGQRAAIRADLAIAPLPVSWIEDPIVRVPGKYGLPDVPDYKLGLYLGDGLAPPAQAAADHLRASFAQARA